MKMDLSSARFSPRLLALSAALMLPLAGGATAETTKNQPRATDAAAAAPKATTVVTAPNARLAALIRPGGAIVRQKGVASVSHPNVGVYCIQPAASTGIVPGNSIVIVTPEFFWSRINEVTVQWASAGSGCGSGRIAVYTLSDFNLDARYRLSDDAAFSIYVP